MLGHMQVHVHHAQDSAAAKAISEKTAALDATWTPWPHSNQSQLSLLHVFLCC